MLGMRRHHSVARAPRRRFRIAAVAAIVVEAIPVWMRGYRWGGRVIVRCRAGHLFTTIWIPGASVKSLRLGWWRLQRCPVGSHWTLVTPVRRSDLSTEDQLTASRHHDLRLP